MSAEQPTPAESVAESLGISGPEGWSVDQEIAQRDATVASLTTERDRLLLQAGSGGVEIDQLRADMEHLRAERDRLREEVSWWESGRRRKGLPVVESVPDGTRYAAYLVRAQGTEGGEDHDNLLVDAAQRLKGLHDAAGHLLAEAFVNRAERDALAAQLEQAERVVEAAVTWRANNGRCPPSGQIRALVAAIDAYQAGPSTSDGA
jgi:hypothetical protein